MDKRTETTNKLIELSTQMNARGASVAAHATEKFAVKMAQEQNINENLLAIMDMIEVTEHALKQVHAQRLKENQPQIKQALLHKEATLRAILNRIDETIDNC